MALTGGSSAGHYRQYPHAASISAVTVSVWVKWNATTASTRAVARGGGTTNGDWLMGLTSGSLHTFAVRLNGVTVVASKTGTVNTGQWYHLAGTYSTGQGQVRLYVDDVAGSQANSAQAMTASTGAVRLFETTSGGNHGNCSVAHLGIWNTLLSTEELTSLSAKAHPASIRPTSLIVCDECDLTSVDLVGGKPTNTGANLADADGPPGLRYIARGPRRGRRGAAAPPGGSSLLLLRLHNERLFTGGFA